MTAPNTWEQERQARLAELQEEPDLAERYAPGTCGAHELLDRAYLAAEFFQQNVLDHPACAMSPDLWAKAAAIAELLGEFYQRAGEVCIEDTDNAGEEQL
jgi:hypothetical protein